MLISICVCLCTMRCHLQEDPRTSKGCENVEDDMNVMLTNLRNQRGRRQGRQILVVLNDETAPTPIPIPPPVLAPASDMAVALMMIAQAM